MDGSRCLVYASRSRAGKKGNGRMEVGERVCTCASVAGLPDRGQGWIEGAQAGRWQVFPENAYYVPLSDRYVLSGRRGAQVTGPGASGM